MAIESCYDTKLNQTKLSNKACVLKWQVKLTCQARMTSVILL